MSDPNFHDRIKDLYRMLFEMATGNLAFRLPPDEIGDEISTLVQILSTFSAQFQLAIKKSGNVVPYYSYQNLTQLLFVLDRDYSMIAFSYQAQKLLKHHPESLIGAGFEALLSEDSKNLWRVTSAAIMADEGYHETIQLHLVSAEGKAVSTFCTVSRLLYSDTIFISTIITNLLEVAALNRSAAQSDKSPDSVLMQNLYEYIMNNLEKPLPTLKELSHLFSTNEFRLKEGFRHFFNTSIYQFYNDERLKRAHLLIQQTDFPLKTVALASGFRDYVTFTKAFKKRFGYGPGTIVRNKG